MTAYRSFCISTLWGLALLTNLGNVNAESSQQQHSATGAPHQFAVTLVEKDKRHPWFGKGLVGRGHEIAFAVDGVPGNELTLVRGQTYEFVIHSDPLHDFYLSTSSVGRGRKVLVAGVEGNFTFDGTVKFTPTALTPNVVYYQCQNHTYMGGRIFIVDKAGQTPQRAAVEDEESEVIKRPTVDPQALSKIVNNKINFAKLTIRSSAGAKRVKSSDHSEAQTMLREADRMITEAETTLHAGEAANAQALVDEAIRTASAAFQMVPNTKEIKKRAKADFVTRVRRLETSLASYESYELTSRERGGTQFKADPNKVRQDLVTAQRLAKEEDYEAANRLLSAAQKSLDVAVAKMLDAQTLTYERSFATPEDEYQYERNRNLEYSRLLATVIEKLKPPQAKMVLISTLSKKGDDLFQKAEHSATHGDFKLAIQTVQNSTGRYQNAIQMAGVRLFGR